MTAVQKNYQLQGNLLSSQWPGCSAASPAATPPGSPESEKSQPFDIGSCSGQSQCSAAKQAVCEMDIPEHLVQLAIDIQRMRKHEDFSNVTELYCAASEIAGSPQLQSDLARELLMAKRRREEEEAQNQQKGLASTVEEDGMECDQPRLALQDDMECDSASPALTDEVDGMKVSHSFPAEMSESSEVTKVDTESKLKHLIAENKKLKHRKLCRVCRKVELAVSGITFLPCGHFITCETCAESLDDCPACGKNIMGTVRTFLS